MKTYQKKVCLIGDFAVGKTSLIRRFVEGIFDEKYLTTVGVVVTRKSLILGDDSIKLLIWDLAGGRDFAQPGYLAGVAGALLVCDLTRASTLNVFRSYARQIRDVNPQAGLVLLGNKADLTDERAITGEQFQSISAEIDAPFLLTSAKSGENVDEAFLLMARQLVTVVTSETHPDSVQKP